MKKIVVIGTGRMGGAFATAFVKRTSHAVSIRGSHAGSSSAAALSRQLGVRVADDKELLAADIVFVATPPAALDGVAAALKGYAGIIVSAMVPGAGGYELKRDDGTSAAEQLARLVPKGRVVTAFTSISSARPRLHYDLSQLVNLFLAVRPESDAIRAAAMTRWLWPPGTRLWLNHTSDSLHSRLLERRLLKYRSSIRAGHLRRIARQVSVVDLRRTRFPLRSALCEDCVRDFHFQSSIRDVDANRVAFFDEGYRPARRGFG